VQSTVCKALTRILLRTIVTLGNIENTVKIVNVHGTVHHKNILIRVYIKQDATLHSLFYLETAPRVLDGTSTHHQERKQLYLQHLVFVTPLLRSAAAIVEELELLCNSSSSTIAAGSGNGVSNTR
jgi:hypothetical protein